MKPPYNNSYPVQLLLTGMILVGLGLIVGVFVKFFAGGNSSEPSPTPQPSTIQSPSNQVPNQLPSQPPNALISPTPSEIKQPDIISLKEFNQIQTGMSVKQVEEIIGTSGKLIGSSEVGKIKGQVYWWQNDQGSNAIIEFRNDKVSSKAQSGLN